MTHHFLSEKAQILLPRIQASLLCYLQLLGERLLVTLEHTTIILDAMLPLLFATLPLHQPKSRPSCEDDCQDPLLP